MTDDEIRKALADNTWSPPDSLSMRKTHTVSQLSRPRSAKTITRSNFGFKLSRIQETPGG